MGCVPKLDIQFRIDYVDLGAFSLTCGVHTPMDLTFGLKIGPKFKDRFFKVG